MISYKVPKEMTRNALSEEQTFVVGPQIYEDSNPLQI
jgi:hypothetical protein